MTHKRTIYLTPPRISSAHIDKKISCIRAHRERISQVSIEERDDRLILHNYGHGGAGWTFLFGCVNESLRLLSNHISTPKKIVVIGAGCHGLLTAICLARTGHSVRIVADSTFDIPSTKAAGFFFPRPRVSSTPHERTLFKTRGSESYRTYQQIINGQHPFITHGARQLPAYFGCDIDPGFAPYVAQGLMSEPEHVMLDFGNGKKYEALHYTTIFIDTVGMMSELHRNIIDLGITITKAHVESFAELPEKIIVNCAGLGAKKLTGDRRIIPVLGHLMSLKDQPPQEHLQYMINVKVTMIDAQGSMRDELMYYAPKESGILGITFIRGQDSLSANEHEFDRLLQRCMDYFGAY